MRLNARAPIIIRGDEITHLDADGYKHLPRAASLPDGKILASSGGAWRPSDLSGVSVSSVFGRTGAVAAQTGDYTAEQVGAEPALPSGGTIDDYLTGEKSWANLAAAVRSAVLTGLSTASSAVVAATDSILVAIGKLQAQVSLRLMAANPNFTGSLLQDGDQRITLSGGGRFTDLALTTLAAGSDLPIVSDEAGVLRNKSAGEFRTIIAAAASDHNHFSKLDVSASANLGSIDASAIKVTATDVTLTCSGGFDGQGWDIIGPYAIGIRVPSGVSLYRYSGITVGPATYAPGGGRALRVVRVDASTWIMPNLS